MAVWDELDPKTISAPGLLYVVERIDPLTAYSTEELSRLWDWWHALPQDTIDIAGKHPDTRRKMFEIVSFMCGDGEAYDWLTSSVLNANEAQMAQALKIIADRENELSILRRYQEQYLAAKDTITKLKAEIYDLRWQEE